MNNNKNSKERMLTCNMMVKSLRNNCSRQNRLKIGVAEGMGVTRTQCCAHDFVSVFLPKRTYRNTNTETNTYAQIHYKYIYKFIIKLKILVALVVIGFFLCLEYFSEFHPKKTGTGILGSHFFLPTMGLRVQMTKVSTSSRVTAKLNWCWW